MKWGVQKTKSEARKDANEYTRAKMFYGEGAGNRCKKIKALASQNMDKHSRAATRERNVKDTTKTIKKTFNKITKSKVGKTLINFGSSLVISYILKKTGAYQKMVDISEDVMSKGAVYVADMVKNGKL